MPVEVSFHPETFEEFFLPVDAKHPGLSEVLKSEFLRYIESRRQLIPSIFGRDVPYTQPGYFDHAVSGSTGERMAR